MQTNSCDLQAVIIDYEQKIRAIYLRQSILSIRIEKCLPLLQWLLVAKSLWRLFSGTLKRWNGELVRYLNSFMLIISELL